MKRETKIRAITRLAAKQEAFVDADTAAEEAAETIAGSDRERCLRLCESAWRMHSVSRQMSEDFRRLAKSQRDYAVNAVDFASRLASDTMWFGGIYSGHTERSWKWGAAADASTSTTRGDRYSSRCSYNKTDATHTVTLSADGIIDLVDNPDIVATSRGEGLPLIAWCERTGKATWVVVKNKRLVAVTGWLAVHRAGDSTVVIYHSTTSCDHAAWGLRRKIREHERMQERAAADAKARRRERLVVRLCRGAKATVADAIAAGYCRPGIEAWQERHGIGDEAPLADLVATGDPLATQLAFSLARKLKREAATA